MINKNIYWKDLGAVKFIIKIFVFLILMTGATSCRVVVQPKLHISKLHKEGTEIVQVAVLVGGANNCDVTEGDTFFYEVKMEFTGCKKTSTGFENSYETTAFIVKYGSSQPEDITKSDFVIFYGKNKSIILYIGRRALEEIKYEISKHGGTVVSIEIEILNDTLQEAAIGISGVWINDVAVGQPMTLYKLMSGGRVWVRLSDVGNASMLTTGREAVAVIPN